jgi:hypothetical protein
VSAVVVGRYHGRYNTVVVPVQYQKDGQEGQQYRYQKDKIPKRGKQQQEDWQRGASSHRKMDKKITEQEFGK